MPTASYPNPVPVVHRQRSPRSQGFFKDDGCEVAPTCLGCPLSQCKDDDREWYVRWLKRGKLLLVGQVMERESLTTQEAARRFRIAVRTAQRARRYAQVASGTLTAEDVEVFILLAEADAPARAGLREVA